MPFKSKSQQRFMFAAEARGDLPEGTAKKWAKHTPDIKALPERVKKKKKDHGPEKEGPKKNPDIPPYEDDKAGGWTQGSQESGAFQKAASFLTGFRKISEPSLAMEANDQSGWSIGDEMPGTSLRNNAETGQFQGKSYRTEGVQNENKEMKGSLKQKAQTARGGKNYGSFREGFSKNSQD